MGKIGENVDLKKKIKGKHPHIIYPLGLTIPTEAINLHQNFTVFPIGKNFIHNFRIYFRFYGMEWNGHLV